MSDTFDHEADAWDDHITRGEHDENEDSAPFNGWHGSKFRVICKLCGKTGLKWRAEAEGWVLFENDRVEHNRLKRHECHECRVATADDFDDVS